MHKDLEILICSRHNGRLWRRYMYQFIEEKELEIPQKIHIKSIHKKSTERVKKKNQISVTMELCSSQGYVMLIFGLWTVWCVFGLQSWEWQAYECYFWMSMMIVIVLMNTEEMCHCLCRPIYRVLWLIILSCL